MSAVSDELNEQVAMFDAVLSDIDSTLRRATSTDLDLADGLMCRSILGSESLGLVRERLDNLLGEKLSRYKTPVPGVGVVERHPKQDPRKVMDDDALWRTVLDTRVIDTATGEVIPQHEVIKRVYGSKSKETGEIRVTGATPTKLDAIGLDPDSFFTEKVLREGWTLRVY